jgi:hypothetical protein
MSSQIDDGKDFDVRFQKVKEYTIWKAANDRASGFTIYDWKRFRSLRDCFNYFDEMLHKSSSQPWQRRFIRIVCFAKIWARLGRQADLAPLFKQLEIPAKKARFECINIFRRLRVRLSFSNSAIEFRLALIGQLEILVADVDRIPQFHREINLILSWQMFGAVDDLLLRHGHSIPNA